MAVHYHFEIGVRRDERPSWRFRLPREPQQSPTLRRIVVEVVAESIDTAVEKLRKHLTQLWPATPTRDVVIQEPVIDLATITAADIVAITIDRAMTRRQQAEYQKAMQEWFETTHPEPVEAKLKREDI